MRGGGLDWEAPWGNWKRHDAPGCVCDGCPLQQEPGLGEKERSSGCFRSWVTDTARWPPAGLGTAEMGGAWSSSGAVFSRANERTGGAKTNSPRHATPPPETAKRSFSCSWTLQQMRTPGGPRAGEGGSWGWMGGGEGRWCGLSAAPPRPSARANEEGGWPREIESRSIRLSRAGGRSGRGRWRALWPLGGPCP